MSLLQFMTADAVEQNASRLSAKEARSRARAHVASRHGDRKQ